MESDGAELSMFVGSAVGFDAALVGIVVGGPLVGF